MSEDSKVAPVKAGQVYLHVSNSGAIFSVMDRGYGPSLEIESSAFGNIVHTFQIHTTKSGLADLRDMLTAALDHEFSEEYCHAAKGPSELKQMRCCGGGKCHSHSDAAESKDVSDDGCCGNGGCHGEVQ